MDDGFEHYRNAGGKERGGFCFVASAVYGDDDHPDVQALRRLRDRVLLGSPSGRRFVSWYYEHGPALSRSLSRSPCT